MIEVFVSRLGLDSSSNSYVVVLQEKEGARLLPIWIGQPEAESIVVHIHNVKRVRPLTHDLVRSLIIGMNATLHSVHITRVEKRTYYAELHLAHGGDIVHIDARPSDAIAIALRLDAPIFANESLLVNPDDETELDTDSDADDENETPSYLTSSAEEQEDDETSAESELSAEQLKRYLETLRPEDFGKFTL